MDEYRWVAARDGNFPYDAAPHGRSEDGLAVWLSRAEFAGETRLGRVGPSFGAVVMGNGVNSTASRYEVLLDAGSWVAVEDGQLPDDAYVCGQDMSGRPLYAARVSVGDALLLARFRPDAGGVEIWERLRATVEKRFEVLVAPGTAPSSPIEAEVPEFVPDGSEFAGLPVVCSTDPAPADPTTVAWKVECDDYDDDESVFEANFDRMLDRAGPAGPTALILGEWGDAHEVEAPNHLLIDRAERMPNLRAVFTGDMSSEQCEISWICQYGITDLLTTFPGLATLRVRGQSDIGLAAVQHDALSTLIIETGGLAASDVRAICGSELPRLSHLELWLGVARYGGTVTIGDLEPILAGHKFPALTYLGLRNAENADDVAAALASAPVVAQLTELDLSMGTLSDEGALALLAGQPLTHLRRLNLSHHFMTAAVAQRLVDELPRVDVDISDRQRQQDWGRYTAVSE